MMASLPTRPVQIAISSRKNTVGSPSVRCQSQVGDKVLPMLRGPADILFLGPRIALGALLTANQNLERLPADIERLSNLAADPRPMEQKQNELFLELEDRVAGCLERGLVAENDVITTINEVIPEEMKASIPEGVRDLVLTPRPIPPSDDWTTAPAPGYSNGSTPEATATWTISSMDEDDNRQFGSSFGSSYASNNGAKSAGAVEKDDEPPVSAATVAASQAAAELVEIQTAVLFVKDQLSALQSNSDASKTSMLKLNLREATQSLERRLEQRAVPAAGGDAAVMVAVQEAQALLNEVKTLLN
ncbi:hypothetical protein Ndes2526B_g04465 [Nannochloris sp. 'desiccata']